MLAYKTYLHVTICIVINIIVRYINYLKTKEYKTIILDKQILTKVDNL